MVVAGGGGRRGDGGGGRGDGGGGVAVHGPKNSGVNCNGSVSGKNGWQESCTQ